MTIPTGEGRVCGLDAADDVGGPPLPLRPVRARANDAKYGGMGFDTRPGDDADDAVVAMERDLYVGNVAQGGD